MEHQISIASPLGSLLLKSDGLSITGISFEEKDIKEQNTCEVLERCREQLKRYFSGDIQLFDLPLHPEGTEFQIRVWNELLKIPY